ncbi:MAG: hypothetical protein IKK47_08795 [Ruminococcus sp.]|nr:hypothetical protein [Ruminococcus sp.]
MAKSKPHKHSGKKHHKHHHENEKVVVKRKSGCFIALLILIAIIALLIWLMSHFNIGFFGKDGGGDSSGSSGTSGNVDTSQITTVDKNTDLSDELTEKIFDITVTGNQYFYDNGKTEIADFIDDILNTKGIVSVRITDNNAYVEYMEELISELEKNNIPYAELSYNNDNNT